MKDKIFSVLQRVGTKLYAPDRDPSGSRSSSRNRKLIYTKCNHDRNVSPDKYSR